MEYSLVFGEELTFHYALNSAAMAFKRERSIGDRNVRYGVLSMEYLTASSCY